MKKKITFGLAALATAFVMALATNADALEYWHTSKPSGQRFYNPEQCDQRTQDLCATIYQDNTLIAVGQLNGEFTPE